jgi:hypothetical protein
MLSSPTSYKNVLEKWNSNLNKRIRICINNPRMDEENGTLSQCTSVNSSMKVGWGSLHDVSKRLANVLNSALSWSMMLQNDRKMCWTVLYPDRWCLRMISRCFEMCFVLIDDASEWSADVLNCLSWSMMLENNQQMLWTVFCPDWWCLRMISRCFVLIEDASEWLADSLNSPLSWSMMPHNDQQMLWTVLSPDRWCLRMISRCYEQCFVLIEGASEWSADAMNSPLSWSMMPQNEQQISWTVLFLLMMLQNNQQMLWTVLCPDRWCLGMISKCFEQVWSETTDLCLNASWNSWMYPTYTI